MAAGSNEGPMSGLVQYLLGLDLHERLEATSIPLPELLDEVRRLQEHCPRCDYVPRVLAALLPHSATTMPSVSQAVVPPLALLRPLLNTRRVLSLMQFVWEDETSHPSPSQPLGQRQQQHTQCASARSTDHLPQGPLHASPTVSHLLTQDLPNQPLGQQHPQHTQRASARSTDRLPQGPLHASPTVSHLLTQDLPNQPLGQRHPQHPQHASARSTDHLPQGPLHASPTVSHLLAQDLFQASPTANHAQAPQDSTHSNMQGSKSRETSGPQLIRLSDSVLTDDALLARFMREGLAHLQAVERGGGGCAWHCVCSGPKELEATEARLVAQRQAALESLEAMEATSHPNRPSTVSRPTPALAGPGAQNHWHASDGNSDDDDVGEEASAAAAAAEAAAAQVAHLSLAPAHSDPSSARAASFVSRHHARSLTQPITERPRSSGATLMSAPGAQEHSSEMAAPSPGNINQLARVAELKDRLQQIDQRLKRLGRAQEHGLEAGGQRLLTLLLSRCWSSLVQHALRAQSRSVLSRLIGEAENKDGVNDADSGEESAGSMVSQSICALLQPNSAAECLEVGALQQGGSFTGHIFSSLSPTITPGLGQTESAKAELRAANERLRLLTQQLEECQAAQTAMGLELTDAADQADAAQARADELESKLRASLARWQGDPAALRGLLPEELQDLAAQMEGAASRVRAAQAQAHAERELLCPCCWEKRKDLVFSCGHLCCSSCGQRLTACPICRTTIDRSRQIKMYI